MTADAGPARRGTGLRIDMEAASARDTILIPELAAVSTRAYPDIQIDFLGVSDPGRSRPGENVDWAWWRAGRGFKTKFPPESPAASRKLHLACCASPAFLGGARRAGGIRPNCSANNHGRRLFQRDARPRPFPLTFVRGEEKEEFNGRHILAGHDGMLCGTAGAWTASGIVTGADLSWSSRAPRVPRHLRPGCRHGPWSRCRSYVVYPPTRHLSTRLADFRRLGGGNCSPAEEQFAARLGRTQVPRPGHRGHRLFAFIPPRRIKLAGSCVYGRGRTDTKRQD